MHGRLLLRFAAEVEFHLRRLFRASLRLEIRPLLETEGSGIEHSRDALDLRVVALHDFVEATSLDRDAVLSAFELRLQSLKTGVCLQIRIALNDHHQPPERPAERPLRLLELRKLSGIGGRVVELNLADLSTRFRDFGERGFLKIGRSFDGLHQIRNQVRAALINILNLRPLSFDGLIG